MEDLMTRTKTGGILAAVVILAVLVLPAYMFALLSAGLLLVAAWEWAGLANVTKMYGKAIYVGIMFLVFAFSSSMLPAYVALIIGILWWLMAIWLVGRYPKTFAGLDGVITRLLIGAIVLTTCWIGLNIIRSAPYGLALIFYFLLLVWITDIAAYFIGSRYGTTKLLPEVSPNKTRQGVYGGVFAALIYAAIFTPILTQGNWFLMMILAFITILASVLGDLFESMLKRLQGVKDSGNILPGHGGLLDRIDGLLAAAPVFALGIVLLQLN